MKRIAVFTGLTVAGIALAGCSAQTHQSAPDPAEVQHSAPHAVVAMPDGFRNVAESCDDGGNMILVTSRGSISLNPNDGPGLASAIAVIQNDPRCAKH